MENYSIISLVGEGSYGRVYKASKIHQPQQVVALKIIEKRGRSNKELKNLRRECDIQQHLCHPNIIEMLTSFETNNEIVVVTEFAKCDLHRLLAREGSIGEVRAQKLAGDLVSALYYLHSHRILHRDLKPQNILLDKDLRAKLCDFGLARNMTMGTHVLTSIKGTPLYMAPELMSEKPYDYQADLWSFGCIIYEAVAGEPPFCTTSFIRLVGLIRHKDVRWPSFLTTLCVSFLQGLLQKDPSNRFIWSQILEHPFVKDKILIQCENVTDSPFTHPLSASQDREKEKQKKEIMEKGVIRRMSLKGQMPVHSDVATTSSHDSINAIIQSDFENTATETDIDEGPLHDYKNYSNKIITISTPTDTSILTQPVLILPDHPNLIVNRFNDNFYICTANTISVHDPLVDVLKSDNQLDGKNQLNNTEDQPTRHRNKNRDLEKKKLTQNLDNFSVRLRKSATEKKTIENNNSIGINGKKDRTPPIMLSGWDSCNEYQSPPIENEEWLAFLNRSMQEILDGEFDGLKQQNLVMIIVAPLRNSRVNCKVIECVTQLLSLPLLLGEPSNEFLEIQKVYCGVKLVPNLIYASKLLCSVRNNDVHSSSPIEESQRTIVYKEINMLTFDELKTLSSLYELVCHLVHLDEKFVLQFCDAVAILGATDLLIKFISYVSNERESIRLANCIIALLSCAIRDLPENAELIEKIIFHPNVKIIDIMKHKNDLLRSRICILLRMMGRFSCYALQTTWSREIRETLEILMQDRNDQVQQDAKGALAEFKHFSFYND